MVMLHQQNVMSTNPEHITQIDLIGGEQTHGY